MNDLNSVLLEGSIHAEPWTTDEGCAFLILSTWHDSHMVVCVRAKGALAKSCLSFCKENRMVRIVGRLMMDEDGTLAVFAEVVDPNVRRTKEEVVE